MSDPRERVSGPGPEGIHPALRTGPLTTGPEGLPQDQPRTKDHEWEERLRAAIAETLALRARKAAMRAEFAERRRYGLGQRHAQKLARNTTATKES
jgi:hypothetical protein